MKEKSVLLLILILVLLMVPFIVYADTIEEVTVDYANFPDRVFRNYVSSQFDTNRNGGLDSAEISGAKVIDLSESGVQDLTGIQYFTALTDLVCSNNELSSLDVSGNSKLENLDCGNNALTSLNVSGDNDLLSLYCGGNQLTELDLSHNTKLRELSCERNQLVSLDLGSNRALCSLDCSGNQLTALNLEANTALWSLDCSENQIASLTLTKNEELWRVVCRYNRLTWINLTGLNKLTFMDCRNNAFTSITKTKGWSSRLQEGSSFLFYPQENITEPNLSDDVIDVKLSRKTYDYNGSKRKPSVTVVYQGDTPQTLKKGIHYTVSYSENKNPGIAAVRIRAIAGNGFVGSRILYFFIKPAKPKLLSIANRENGITVKWKTVPGAASYRIYRKDGSGKYKVIAEEDCRSAGKTKLSYKDKKIRNKNGKMYRYTVSAVAGNGVYGDVEGDYRASGLRMVRLVQPEFTDVANSSKTTMSLMWEKNADAGGYELEYADNYYYRESRTVRIKKAGTPFAEISGLTKGKRYHVRVRAWKTVSGDKYYSPWSIDESVKIKK